MREGGCRGSLYFILFCPLTTFGGVLCFFFSLPSPHSAAKMCAQWRSEGRVHRRAVLYCVLPPLTTFSGVLCFTVSRPVRRGSVPLLCPPTSPLRAGSGGKPSNVTKKQNIPQRGLQITGFLLYYPKKQIFNSAQRCRQGWNFGEVQLRL